MSTHDFDPDFPGRGDARRRWVALGVLSAAALLLHLAALGGLSWAWPPTEAVPLPNPTLQVRLVDLPAAPRQGAAPVAEPLAPSARSEERRVGKECRL